MTTKNSCRTRNEISVHFFCSGLHERGQYILTGAPTLISTLRPDSELIIAKCGETSNNGHTGDAADLTDAHGSCDSVCILAVRGLTGPNLLEVCFENNLISLGFVCISFLMSDVNFITKNDNINLFFKNL